MQNSSIKVNGVQLSAECLTVLEQLQSNGNESIYDHKRLIDKTMCFLAKHLNGRTPANYTDADLQLLISDLAYLRDNLASLKAIE